MTTRTITWALGGVLLCLSHTAFAEEWLKTLLGNAYDLDSGELVYQEHHRFEYKDDRMIAAQVEYRRSDGTPIASKTLDFSRNPNLPAFETVHAGGRFIEGLEYRGDELFIYTVQDGKQQKSKTLELRDDMAADAGFNNLVYKNYDTLMTGETIKFRFVAPNHLTSVKFKAKKIGTRTIEDLSVVDFKVSIKSFLSLFVEPLLLSYDPITRNLIEYQGLSNIRDKDGELFNVRIRYPALLTTSKHPPKPGA